MSISQGNGPLTAGMAVGLTPQPEQSDADKMDALYEEHADGNDIAVDGEAAEGDDDVDDPDDLFNNDALKE
jgi:hypothetical protein